MPELLSMVDFDFAAARAAAAACRDMAARLDVLLDRRAGGSRFGGDWQGLARRDFDTISDALTDEGDDYRTRLLATAAAIDDAADEARAENQRRADENDRRVEEARRDRERAEVQTG